jgi:hypothetical protein
VFTENFFLSALVYDKIQKGYLRACRKSFSHFGGRDRIYLGQIFLYVFGSTAQSTSLKAKKITYKDHPDDNRKRTNLKPETLNLGLLCKASKDLCWENPGLTPISSNFSSVNIQQFDLLLLSPTMYLLFLNLLTSV